MRAYGALRPIDSIPLPPDTVATFVMTGGSSAQASDWFSSASTALTQAGQLGANGPGIVRFTGMTSAGSSLFNFMVNMYSTLAVPVPTSGTTVGMGASSGVSIPIYQQGMFQVPPQSTGYSIAALTSGLVFVEMWRK